MDCDKIQQLNKNEIKWVVGYMQACERGENYDVEPPTKNVVEYVISNKLHEKTFNEYICEILLNISDILHYTIHINEKK